MRDRPQQGAGRHRRQDPQVRGLRGRVARRNAGAFFFFAFSLCSRAASHRLVPPPRSCCTPRRCQEARLLHWHVACPSPRAAARLGPEGRLPASRASVCGCARRSASASCCNGWASGSRSIAARAPRSSSCATASSSARRPPPRCAASRCRKSTTTSKSERALPLKIHAVARRAGVGVWGVQGAMELLQNERGHGGEALT
jgi:hypothetical protein